MHGPSPRFSGREIDLARACSRGEPQAMRYLEARYFPEISGALARMGFSAQAIDEVAQALRAHLFVSSGERPPKIADYAGEGALGAWLRITAIRLALRLERARKREIPMGDECLLEVADQAGDLELGYIKSQHGALFRDALYAALRALQPREQNLLRQHFLDGLTLDELASCYRVHRATVARWLQEARSRLLRATRAAIMERLGATPSECDSLIQAARSYAQITLERLLRRGPGRPRISPAIS